MNTFKLSFSRIAEVALHGAAYLAAAIAMARLAWVTWTRVIFPWDLLVWAESPFLTNMLKIHNGVSFYSDAADGNSFVYAPGLEYVTFLILRPFGLHLDIRYCRSVTVFMGLIAALVAAYTTYRVAKRISDRRILAFPFVALAFATFALVIFGNFAADVPHPDNFHILHAVVVLMLTLVAVQSQNMTVAIACMLFAGFGVFAKQTEAIAFLGPACAFAVLNPWGWRRTAMLLSIGGGTMCLALCVLWLHPHGKFYTFDIPSSHAIRLSHIPYFAELVIKTPTFILAVLGITHLWRLKPEGKRYLTIWFCTGVFSAAPNMAPFMKAMGSINNLAIMNVWFILGAWPFLGLLPRLPDKRQSTTAWDGRILGFLANLAIAGYLLTLTPNKAAPNGPDYDYCQRIQDAVSRDVASGRSVLVTHGTMFKIRAGERDVPRDRANSILELWQGGWGDFPDMTRRLAEHHYDRIYVIADDFYNEDVRSAMREHYKEIDALPASPHQPGAASGAGVRTGMQVFMIRCPVLAPISEEGTTTVAN